MSEDTKLYRLWCEWDIGHEYIVFKTEEIALLWAEKVLHSSGIEESLDELLDEGLIGIEEVELIGGKDESMDGRP